MTQPTGALVGGHDAPVTDRENDLLNRGAFPLKTVSLR